MPGLLVLAAMLTAAFGVAPFSLAASAGVAFGGEADLRAAAHVAVLDYWTADTQNLTAGLSVLVEFWFRFHLAKAVFAALLVAVFIALAVRCWRAAPCERWRRAGTAFGAAVSAGMAALSLLVVMANVQGAVAPSSSLLPMIPDEVRSGFGAALRAGVREPAALPVLIGDFSRYHAAMAVVAGLVAAAVIAAAVYWRRTRFGIVAAVLACGVVVIGVANTMTALNPVPALQAFFDGGW
ncbi:uncharacterized protein RMCC_2407 [Mycolicibacterium canariasense]|uniref:Transmembrane protein n=1 Tax=Mycolicibacterium canariasense TaxID=228230 RepID=A0A100WC18_MYCCR|nr:hypothetical protein [Mycolicibacterium canariasense]MCV7209038.1 hypothetical protein [Mycolicibacterium canariasense]ORV06088.1 hypothetical protein AWB94_19650 [Mycolicibacterium canariasense]GAS95441.1 uncharacterized protein RMCC_2407 [Mycolicibacterium canariasense]